MKFLLCADLHLDSALGSNFSEEQAKRRRRELLETFRSIVRIAVEESVSAVVIAGDLFDQKKASAKSREYVLGEMASHPEISFLYLRGNHDCGFGDMNLPANLSLFSSDGNWVTYRFGTTVFCGNEHPEMPDVYESLNLSPEDRNIVVMHGQVHSSASSAASDTVCLKLLKNRNVDLLALGHIHSYTEGTLDRRAQYVYPGCPDARGFDECGVKGVVICQVPQSGTAPITTRFVPCSSRVFHRVDVPMDGLVSYPDIEAAVRNAVADFPGTDAVRVSLVGQRHPDARLDTEHLSAVLSERFWCSRVKDETRLMLSVQDYVGDISLKGEFIRQVFGSKLPEQEKDRVILAGLRALRGEDIGL